MLCWIEPLKQPEQHYYWRASSKSWTSSMFESMIEDTVCSIHPLCLLWFLVVLLIFFDYNHVISPSTTNVYFNKILQTTQQPKTLDGAAQGLHVWWTVWASDGRERYCLYGMPFHLGFWASRSHLLVWFFRHKNVKSLQRTLGYYHAWPPHVLC